MIGFKEVEHKSQKMKKTVFLLLCILSFSSLKAQIPDLTGTWTMFEMTYVSDQGTQKMTEDQMKENGAFVEFFFIEEGKFRQTGNMSGSGKTESQEGTWKLEGDQLMLTLKIGDQKMDLTWKAEYKNNALNLSRTSPDGSMTIINTFRKK